MLTADIRSRLTGYLFVSLMCGLFGLMILCVVAFGWSMYIILVPSAEPAMMRQFDSWVNSHFPYLGIALFAVICMWGVKAEFNQLGNKLDAISQVLTDLDKKVHDLQRR